MCNSYIVRDNEITFVMPQVLPSKIKMVGVDRLSFLQSSKGRAQLHFLSSSLQGVPSGGQCHLTLKSKHSDLSVNYFIGMIYITCFSLCRLD